MIYAVFGDLMPPFLYHLRYCLRFSTFSRMGVWSLLVSVDSVPPFLCWLGIGGEDRIFSSTGLFVGTVVLEFRNLETSKP